jgi:hypothetical protein
MRADAGIWSRIKHGSDQIETALPVWTMDKSHFDFPLFALMCVWNVSHCCSPPLTTHSSDKLETMRRQQDV